jgi:hypothetical protein
MSQHAHNIAENWNRNHHRELYKFPTKFAEKTKNEIREEPDLKINDVSLLPVSC